MSEDLLKEKKLYDEVMEIRNGDINEESTSNLMEKINSDGMEINLNIHNNPDYNFGIKISVYNDKILLKTFIGETYVTPIAMSRLEALYMNHNKTMSVDQKYIKTFFKASFLLLFRYSYIDPGMHRQGFLVDRITKSINRCFGGMNIDMEAFSSALNSKTFSYCSLMSDVESPFGSRGSFFDQKSLRKTDKLILVNPPRIGSVIIMTINHLEKLLKEKGDSLTYAVLLVPYKWPDVLKMIKDTGLVVAQMIPRIKRIGPKVDFPMFEYEIPDKNETSFFPAPAITILSNFIHDVEHRINIIEIYKSIMWK